MHSLYVCLEFFIAMSIYRSYTSSSSLRNRQPTSQVGRRDPNHRVNHTCIQYIGNRTADCTSRHLVEVPQELNRDIQRLFLSDNNLRILRNTTFQEYPEITELYLERNSINCIERRTLYPLSHLRILRLIDNPELDLRGNIFQRSFGLQVLTIALCNLSSFALGITNLKNGNGAGNMELGVTPSYGRQPMSLIDLCWNNVKSVTPIIDNFGVVFRGHSNNCFHQGSCIGK